MAFLDRHPVLKRAVANQYQAILLAGAAGFSLLFANPLPLALLFGATASGRGVSPKTVRTILAAIQVKGVPDIAVEEALWLAASVMRA